MIPKMTVLAAVFALLIVFLSGAVAQAHNVGRTTCIQLVNQSHPTTYTQWKQRFRRCARKARAHNSRHAWKRELAYRWRLVAQCESGRRWDYNGSSGFDGGLQFHPRTWNAYRVGISSKAYAYQATPHRQRLVAREVRRAQGLGAWPHCGRYWRQR